MLAQARARELLSDEHFTVDATLIEAWASLKSFRRKDGGDEPPPDDPGKERAGHSSVAFTLDRYSWVTPSMQEVAVETLSRSLSNATGLLPAGAVSGG